MGGKNSLEKDFVSCIRVPVVSRDLCFGGGGWSSTETKTKVNPPGICHAPMNCATAAKHWGLEGQISCSFFSFSTEKWRTDILYSPSEAGLCRRFLRCLWHTTTGTTMHATTAAAATTATGIRTCGSRCESASVLSCGGGSTRSGAFPTTFSRPSSWRLDGCG